MSDAEIRRLASPRATAPSGAVASFSPQPLRSTEEAARLRHGPHCGGQAALGFVQRDDDVLPRLAGALVTFRHGADTPMEVLEGGGDGGQLGFVGRRARHARSVPALREPDAVDVRPTGNL